MLIVQMRLVMEPKMVTVKAALSTRWKWRWNRGVDSTKALPLFLDAQISSLSLHPLIPFLLSNPPFTRTSFKHNCFHTWKAHWSHSRWPLQRQKPQWYDLSGVRAQKLGREPSLRVPCGQLQNTICSPKPPLPFLLGGWRFQKNHFVEVIRFPGRPHLKLQSCWLALCIFERICFPWRAETQRLTYWAGSNRRGTKSCHVPSTLFVS